MTLIEDIWNSVVMATNSIVSLWNGDQRAPAMNIQPSTMNDLVNSIRDGNLVKTVSGFSTAELTQATVGYVGLSVMNGFIKEDLSFVREVAIAKGLTMATEAVANSSAAKSIARRIAGGVESTHALRALANLRYSVTKGKMIYGAAFTQTLASGIRSYSASTTQNLVERIVTGDYSALSFEDAEVGAVLRDALMTKYAVNLATVSGDPETARLQSLKGGILDALTISLANDFYGDTFTRKLAEGFPGNLKALAKSAGGAVVTADGVTVREMIEGELEARIALVDEAINTPISFAMNHLATPVFDPRVYHDPEALTSFGVTAVTRSPTSFQALLNLQAYISSVVETDVSRTSHLSDGDIALDRDGSIQKAIRDYERATGISGGTALGDVFRDFGAWIRGELTEIRRARYEAAVAAGYTGKGDDKGPKHAHEIDHSKTGTGGKQSGGPTVGGGTQGSHEPIVFDLDGDGVEITELSSSNTFFDTEGDGYKRRTAWAGTGDGVLAIDADGDGKITEREEIIFTDWDPSAKDDLEALRSVFDTDNNGVLDQNDKEFSKFRIVVTKDDGTTVVKTLDDAGVESIKLTTDSTEINLQDGSSVDGLTTYTKTEANGGGTGKAAAVTFATELQGYAIDNSVVTDAGGTKITNVARDADGGIAEVTVTETTADGKTRTITCDYGGDGVIDKEQTIQIVDNGGGIRTETITNKNGGDVLLDQTKTEINPDGSDVKIWRDTRGGGYFDETETRILSADILTVELTRLNPDGSKISREIIKTTSDGLSRNEEYDDDSNGSIDLKISEVTVEEIDHSRTKTVERAGNDGTLLSRVVTKTDPTGQNRTIEFDDDGDGKIDLKSTVTVVNELDGDTITTEVDENRNGSLRGKIEFKISADSLTQTTEIDRDGSGTYELTISDVTTLETNDDRTQVISEWNKDGSLRDKSTIIKKVDGRGRDITIDRDGDGTKDRTELIEINAGVSVTTITEWNDDGTRSFKSIATTSVDGLTTVTQIDSDGTSDYETVVNSVTVRNIDGKGTATVTETVNNGAGSLRGKTVTHISADGLSSIARRDRDGNGAFDLTRSDITVLKAGNAYERTVTETFANGALGSHSFTTTSADRNNIYSTRDLNGDGAVDQIETIDRQANGDVVDTVTNFTDHGSTINRNVTTTSANGLLTKVQVDENGDTAFDRTTITLTELKVDGSRTTTTTTKSSNNTEISKSEVTTSGNGLSVTTDIYLNGDLVLDLRTKDVTVLEEGGDETRTLSDYNGNDKLRSSTIITTSDDGLSITIGHDVDGDLAFESKQTDITVLEDNGSTTRTVSNYNGAVLHDETKTNVSADGRTVDRTTIDNSLSSTKQTYERIVEADGDIVEKSKSYSAGGALISQSDTTTSDNGLVVTSRVNFNADNFYDDVVKSSAVRNIDGSTVVTETVNNANGSLRGQTVTTTSGNGLVVTSKTDRDGNGSFELTTSSVTALNGDGSIVKTVTDTFGNGALAAKSITTTRADRDTVYAWRDTNGDGAHDQTQLTIREADGDLVDTMTSYRPDGQMITRSVVTTSANGLSATTQVDLNADDVFDRTASQVTVLEADGDRVTTTTAKAANGAQISKATTTVTGNGLSVTTLSDINGDSVNDATTTDLTELGADGSRTRTLSNLNGAGTITISSTKTVTSDDGLLVTTEFKLDGDASVDLTTKDVTVLDANGSTIRTVTNTNANGLLDKTVTTTSADGRTIDSKTNGYDSVDFEQTYSRTIENNGDIRETVSNFDATGLLNYTTTITSANGLNVSTYVDQDGNGSADYVRYSATTLNADGSRTQTITNTNNTAAPLINKQVTTVSGNGLSTTVQTDQDGNGSYDLTTTTVRTLNQDGSVVDSVTETNANGSQRTQTVTTTSGDRKTVTIARSLAGVVVQNETRVLENDGDTVSTVESKNTVGTLLSTIVTTTHADGLYEQVVTKNGASVVIDTQTTTIALNADGGRTVTVAQDGAVDGTTVTTTSADGLKKSTQTTLTGVMTTTASSVDQTVLNADGSRTQTVTVSSPNGLKDRAVVTTSANGLKSDTAINVDGDATDDIIASSITATDGSKVETVTYKNLKTGTIRRQEEVSASVDGRTVTLKRDTDGIGSFDVTIETVKNADGSVTESRVGAALGGVPAYSHVSKTGVDLDGGVKVVTEFFNDMGALVGRTTSKEAPNGLNETVTFDLDGDNIIDKQSTKTTALNADGSTTETERFIITGGIPSSTRVTTRNADGSSTTTTFDLDGNGRNEQSSTTLVAMDGSIVHTFKTFDNETAAQLSSRTITIAANGLQEISKADFDRIVWSLQSTGLRNNLKQVFGAASRTGSEWVYTIAKDTLLDTTTIFASSEGSNQWVRTVNAAQAATATHFIDANGIETWSWDIVSPTLWAANSSMLILQESGSIQIDAATRDLYMERGDNIYSAALGRDMAAEEQQLLAQYIMGGVLNESLLANHILASEEFTTKYGSMTDRSFILRLFTNALGHLPSTELRDYYEGELTSGRMTRTDVLTALGSSIESSQLSRSIWQNGVTIDTVESFQAATSAVTFNLNDPANTGIDNVIGTKYNDQLVGDSSANLLAGSDGNDTLSGAGGRDTLLGGLGDDSLDGGGGVDTVSFENASAGIWININQGLSNGEGSDTVTAVENVIGSKFADSIIGDENANRLEGGDGNDAINAGGEADTIYGGAGDDVIWSSNGADSLYGGSGIDTAAYNHTSAVEGINVNLATDTATGNFAGGDKYSSIENLIGTKYADALTGDAGDNRLDGDGGDDELAGGAGNDTYVSDVYAETMTEAANAGIDTAEITWATAGTFTLFANVENAVLLGTAALNGTGNVLDNAITGNSAVNKLTGADGNDTLNGGAGIDTLIGGAGDDLFVVDDAGEMVTENVNEGIDGVHTSVTLTLAANVENLLLTGDSAISGTGNALANGLTGNAKSNVLTGNDGDDWLQGRGGADSLIGGNGTDFASYSAAAAGITASLSVGATNTGEAAGDTYNSIEALYGSNFSDSLQGDGAANILDGSTGADTLKGGAGDDTYVVENAGDVVVENAGEGTDTVQSVLSLTLGANLENLILLGSSAINAGGNTLNNVLTGNSGSNWLDGGVGSDTLQGGTGDDIYVVDSAGDVVTEAASAGSETVMASISYALGANLENLQLQGTGALSGTGNTLANFILGNSGANSLSGGDSDDYLAGGLGADTLDGGNGSNDFAHYQYATQGLTVSLKTPANNTGEAAGDVFIGIENILGSTFNDLLEGNASANNLNGEAGDDTLIGGAGADALVGAAGTDTASYEGSAAAVTVNLATGAVSGGDAASDTFSSIENLIGSGNADSLTGNTQGNYLDGRAGKDTMAGGAGDDTYVTDITGETITEVAGAGTDTVEVTWTSGTYTLGTNVEIMKLLGASAISGNGNAADNVIWGNAAANTLSGADGNDVLVGQGGADQMLGGAGDDVYWVGDATDVVTENASEGVDTVNSTISFTLGANVEHLTLTDVLAINGTGNELNNVITGNSAGNTLTGGDGNDTLDGGAGADTLIGGKNNDTFVVDDIGDVLIENADEGIDTVLASITYALTVPGLNNLVLTGAAALNGTGNGSGNAITGNTAGNTLTGAGGNDTLDGGGGNDTLVGGTGNDAYVVDTVDDVVVEKAAEGTDTIQSSVTLTLGAEVENLTLIGTSAINATGNAGNNVLTGNSGSNWLVGGVGSDTMQGGTGDDVYVVDNAADVVIEAAGAGNEWVEANLSYTIGANIENLTLTGTGSWIGTGNSVGNMMFGNSAANVFYGLEGNDSLFGAGGADTLDGGNGSDWAFYRYTSQGITASLNTPGTNGGDAAGDSYVSIENLWGSKFDDTLEGGVGTAVNLINGDAGNDTVIGTLGADTIDGGEGVDTISYVNATVGIYVQMAVDKEHYWSDNIVKNFENVIGSKYNDILYGSAADNRLDGGLGDDTYAGYAGNDTYVIDLATEGITESANQGFDTVESKVTYTLGANLERLILTGDAIINGTGNTLNNHLVGNSKDNVLKGGGGEDSFWGGDGNDTYVVDSAADVVFENADEGTADLVESSVSLALEADLENLTLTGAAVINGTGNAVGNVIIGNTAANILVGADGNDTLTGGSGNDTLDAGAGSDALDGGLGTDTVTYANAAQGVLVMLGSASPMPSGGALGDTYVGIENAVGSAFTDTIHGTTGNNVIDGGAGDDYLLGWAGNDTLSGGAGSDTVQYWESTAGVTVNLSTGQATGTAVGTDALTGIENIEGSNHNDTLTGDGGNNVIAGAAGVDTMAGGAGDDRYVVDVVGDVVTEAANAGIDTIETSISFDLSTKGANVEQLVLTGSTAINGTGNALNNQIWGNAANNTFNAGVAGGSGEDTLRGGGGNDIYYIDSAGDIAFENANEGLDWVYSSVSYVLGANLEYLGLTGSAAINATGNGLNNSLAGNNAGNILAGGDGDDWLVGFGGADTINGGNGIDWAAYDGATAGLTASLANSAINTGEAAGDIYVAIEYLYGTTYADMLEGNAGNNFLYGSGGSDTLKGGLGDDSYHVDSASDVLQEAANEGADHIQSSISYTLGTNFESLELLGSGHLTGSGNGSNNSVHGNAGNNVLFGLDGDDILYGRGGADTLNGGNGSDIAAYLEAGAGITASLANSALNTGVAAGDVYVGIEHLVGTGHSDVLEGDANGNYLDGSVGVDTVRGGGGNDSYLVDMTADVVVEFASEGTDVVSSFATYSLSANVENLTLIGTAAINGTGNALNNGITGNAASNILAGGVGSDTLTGGTGADVYQLGRGEGADQITASTSDGSADRLAFGASVAHDQLWFNQSGSDLVISIIGTSDSMTVKGWYAAGNDQLDRIEMADGDYLLTNEVSTLVNAMSSMTAPPLGQTSLTAQQQQQLAPALAVWHQAA